MSFQVLKNFLNRWYDTKNKLKEISYDENARFIKYPLKREFELYKEFV